MKSIDSRQHRGSGMTSQRARKRLVERLRRSGIDNEMVLETIFRTPRHLFVDEALASRAYEDTALPIGFGQTISQAYLVARMTQIMLERGRPDSVLEIGTGSGYQSAVLAPLVGKVYSVERIGELLERARVKLRALGLQNVWLKYDDGHLGWPRYSPFRGIIVTAATEDVPLQLLEQLEVGGRLLAPVGDSKKQALTLIERKVTGFETQALEPVTFVPLLGGTH